MKESFRKKLLRSRMTWIGHVERMGDEKLARTDAQKVDGKGKRGRPIIRWEACVNRDLGRVGGRMENNSKR